MFSRIVIAFGSESRNSELLAKQLSTLPLLQTFPVTCQTLDQVEVSSLHLGDLLLIITSTFGDGEPPSNAEVFQQKLADINSIRAFQYAIFSLGDVAYTNFCQFGKWLDQTLQIKGAKKLINRVDADTDYHYFFTRWQKCINAIFSGFAINGLDLQLQVCAYNEINPHSASIISTKRLNSSADGVYQVTLNLSASGIHYRAGDILYVTPKGDSQLLNNILDWFGHDKQDESLKNKELRILNKSLLRKLANASGCSDLKEMLKIKNKAKLEAYLYGRDLLDILKECGNAGYISLPDLTELLSTASARAYSIASCNSQEGGSENQVSLCIRDVSYQMLNRTYFGSTSYPLCHALIGDKFSVFARANPEFHLNRAEKSPLIMIGAGTGIAPYIGFLSALETTNLVRETMIVFGERKYDQDFLYKTELENWLSKGVLNHLITAFSQDQKEKYYVQHALIKHGSDVYRMLELGADIYICGSKKNLDNAIDEAILHIFIKYGHCSDSQAELKLTQLIETNKLHKDLY